MTQKILWALKKRLLILSTKSSTTILGMTNEESNTEPILKIGGKEIFFKKPENPISDEKIKTVLKKTLGVIGIISFLVCILFWSFTKR